MKFDKIKPGMVLYDRHKHRAGNTTMRVLGEWRVTIISVDPAARTAMVSWNGNRPSLWFEGNLAKLKDWSMYDECAERTEGMIGTISVKKRRKTAPSSGEKE